MKFGELLQALFKASKMQKTDFAVALSYSPGEISKYISGNRLPPQHRLEEFVGISAAYFAEAFWRANPEESVRGIFPISREFSNKAQLVSFLGHALHLAYDETSREDDLVQYGIIRNELIFQGEESIYNHVLITLSNALREQGEVHVYLSMLFFRHYLARMNSAMRDTLDGHKVYVHLLFNLTHVKSYFGLEMLDFLLGRWANINSIYQVDVLVGRTEYRHPHFYLKDYYLLSINEFLEDAPYGTRIQDPGYLFRYNMNIEKVFRDVVSFSPADLPLEKPEYRQILLDMVDTCEEFYIFANICFLADRKLCEQFSAPTEIKELMYTFIKRLMQRDIPMVVSLQAMDRFSDNMILHVPLLGEIRMNKEQSEAYLYKFLSEDQENFRVKVSMTDADLMPFALLVLKDKVLVYAPPQEGSGEQFALFPREMCDGLLRDLVMLRETRSIPLTRRLLENYLKILPSLRGKGISSYMKLNTPLRDF